MLRDFGVGLSNQPRGAVHREAKLFDEHLKLPKYFGSVDRTATRAALSNINNLGNHVAHTGEALNALETELVIVTIPRATTSLGEAVRSASGGS